MSAGSQGNDCVAMAAIIIQCFLSRQLTVQRIYKLTIFRKPRGMMREEGGHKSSLLPNTKKRTGLQLSRLLGSHDFTCQVVIKDESLFIQVHSSLTHRIIIHCAEGH